MEVKNLRLETITPDRARWYLQYNTKNRPVRKGTVLKYAADMKAGRWNEDVLDPIMVSSDKRLINGQHRLLAVMLAEVPVKMYTMIGCDDNLYEFIDSGASRSVPDVLDIPDARAVTAIATRLCAITEHGATIQAAMKETTAITKQEKIAYIAAHGGELQELLSFARRMRKAVNTGAHSTYGLFGGVVRFVGLGDDLDSFVRDFQAEDSDSHICRSIKFTILRASNTGRGVVENRWLMGNLLFAYEKFMTGEKVGSINKSALYLDKYNKLISETFERKRISGEEPNDE